MTQNLTQNLIDLSDRSLGSYRTLELALNHGEHGLDVRPLMIVSQEGFLIVVVEVPQPVLERTPSERAKRSWYRKTLPRQMRVDSSRYLCN